jgi:hypothetical protein
LTAASVGLAGGKLRGTIDKPLPDGAKPVKLPEGDKPFAHPAYWAAFVLVGDPSEGTGQPDNCPEPVGQASRLSRSASG